MSDKYFPAKPADVTCATCPYARASEDYSYAERGNVPRFSCAREPNSDYTSDGTGWCGEHPWFVAQREDLRAQALAKALDLPGNLADLATNLSK